MPTSPPSVTQPHQRSALARGIWFTIAIVSLGLGILGAFLPLLPTTPFILLAVAGFARSSQKRYDWLMNHPVFGPSIRNWQEHRAISPKAKRMAIFTLVLTFGISLAFQVSTRTLIIQAVALSAVAIMIMTRPSGPKK